MPLTLIRHGQSIANRTRTFSGQSDVPLTEQGIREAEAAGRSLRGRSFAAVFTSPLERAMMTANLVLLNSEAPLPASWTVGGALRERYEGILEGLPRARAAIQFGEPALERWESDIDARLPEGETIRDCHDRVTTYVRAEITPLARDISVLVVAHSWVIRAILADRRGLGPESIPAMSIGNCQIIDDDTPLAAFMVPKPVPQDI